MSVNRKDEIEGALRSGEHGRAIGLSRRLLAVSPADGACLQLQGIAFASLGRDDQGIIAIRRAVWADPDGGALVNLAALLLSLARNDEAGPVLRRGLALSPQATQGWDFRRQQDAGGGLVELGRICALTGSLSHELQHANLRIAAGMAAAVACRLRTLLHGRPELIEVARALLSAIDVLSRTHKQPSSAPSGEFGQGLAQVAVGRLEEAAASFHADFETDPASVGSRAAYASAIHIVTDNPPARLEVPGIGSLSVERVGKAFRLTPLDRPRRGRFLFGYSAGGVLLPEIDERFRRHSNQWESRAIARMLIDLGFTVDLVGLFDTWPNPESYDAVFCLHNALARHAARLRRDCRKIMFLTGSSPDFQNRQEACRLRDLRQRTGVTAPPVRSLDDVEGELASLRLADECWLLGNDATRATYETPVQGKIRLLSPSGAPLRIAGLGERAVGQHRWFWFSGHGAVLKGLDRVMEIFLRRPDWRLEIVGPAVDEPWFRAAYGDGISRSGTIAIHGTLSPVSFDFTGLVESCVGFLAPSASEGQSTSAITCLQAGLFPILSRQCGIDLPPGCGIMLETCGIEEIEAAIDGVHRLPEAERRRQVGATTADARRRFSREAFRTTLAQRLQEATASIGR